MTKRPLLFIVLVTVVLAGCVASGPSGQVENKKPVELAFPPAPDEPRYYYDRMLRSSADVLPVDEAVSLKSLLTGEQRRGEGLAKPYAVKVRHGRVYVTDAVQHAVIVFDIPGKKFYKIGTEEDDDGHGKVSHPIGLALDKQGTVYVLDAKQKQILVYNQEGKYLRSFGDSTMLYKPAALAVTPDGTRVYAVDIGGSSSNEHKIVVFNGVTGERLPDIGKRGGGPGEFNLPRDVAIAQDGSLYVVDGGNFRVQKFDKDGKFLFKFGEIGRRPGQFSRPKGAAIDPSGNVYITDAAFGNFQIFNAEGQMLLAIGSRSNSNGPALYVLPAGIDVDDDGRVYVIDQYFRKIDIYRPVALAADAGWIGKFNPNKAFSEYGKDEEAPASTAKVKKDIKVGSSKELPPAEAPTADLPATDVPIEPSK